MGGNMRNILLIVGNGLSMDLRKWASPQLEEWNPQYPLQWDVNTPGNSEVPFLESLPLLTAVITSLRQDNPDISDFDIFKRGLQLTKDNGAPLFSQLMLAAEMEHYLAVAYSHFQLEVDKININSWPWLKWLNTYGKNVQGVVSFNYDLVLESALNQSGVSVARFGVKSEVSGVPTLKPHGSIDFRTEGISAPMGYPLKNIFRKNNSPLKTLEKNELLEPRLEVNIVLPNEYSPQLNYQWVKPGYDWVRSAGPRFTHCIIAGLSHWDCDRSEIDFLINSLSSRTKLIVANPSPPHYLMSILRKKFEHKVKVWRNGPEDFASSI